jgi:predicted methyltransferase
MVQFRRVMLAAAAAVLAAGAGSALSQTEAPKPASGQAAVDTSTGDAVSNPAFHGSEVIAFMGLKPGDRVADIVAGRFTRALSLAVGPKGHVYAVEPAEVVKVHPNVVTLIQGLASTPAFANVSLSTPPVNALDLPRGLDAVFIRQNYHDLHDKFMGPADIAGFNRAVFAALKPGGVFVVLDHAAAPGSGLSATETLHRIDPDAVINEVLAAGFVLDGTSYILANPEDPRDKNVFDGSIRGRTDQFLLRFRKPR